MNARDEWLAARRLGVGGSDIGAIMGLSPYRTPMDVWLDKRGEPQPISNAEAMYWGTVLEDVVATEYAKRTGYKVQRINGMMLHPQRPWMIANIDRAVVNPAVAGNVRWRDGRLTTDRILECKTANGFMAPQWGEPGSDNVPDGYLLQCQWYMAVTGTEVADLAVLIGGSDFRTYTIERNETLIEQMIEAGATFWQGVISGVAPDPQTVADAQRKWPQHAPGVSVIVDSTVAGACDALAEIALERKRIEAVEDGFKTHVLKNLGAAEEATYMGRKLCTWKTQETARIDTKALKEAHPDIAQQFTTKTTSRVFRLAKQTTKESA